MTFLRRAALALVIVFCAAAAIIGALWHSDLVRKTIADTASTALGRRVELTGVRFLWSWNPGVVLRDVTVAGVDGGADGDFLRVRHLKLRIQTSELFKFNLVFREVGVTDGELNLVRSSAEAANWKFLTDDEGAPADRSGPSEGPLSNVRALDLDNVRIRYRDAVTQADLNFTVKTVREGGQARLAVMGEGRFKKRAMQIKVSADSLHRLWGADRPYGLTADLKYGKTSLRLSGTVAIPLKLEGINARFELQGANLARLFTVTGVSLPATPPYRLNGSITRNGTLLKIRDFDGRIGDSDMSGDVSIDLSDDRPKLAAELISKRLDFDDLGTLIGVAPDTKKGETASKSQKRSARRRDRSERVMPDIPMDLRRIRAIDADVTFEAKRVETDRIPIDDLKMKMTLERGVLVFKPIEFGTGGGGLRADIEIDASEDAVRTDISGRAARLPMETVLQAFMGKSKDTRKKTAGLLGGTMRLRTTGNTLHRALASAEGNAFLAMSEGEISSLLVELLGLDVAETLLLLGSTKARKQITPVRCVIMDYGIDRGIMTARSFLLDTKDTLVIGSGQIDLGREVLDLKLEPHPRDSSFASARATVRVGGTFKNPTIAPDALDIAKKVGLAAALGALATPLAAVLPFLEQGEEVKSPCHQSITEIIKGGQ